tara:strand:- start:589 stop:729 length:141 start_codon:yes stop_codon:yes gene_type:complete
MLDAKLFSLGASFTRIKLFLSNPFERAFSFSWGASAIPFFFPSRLY